MRRGTGPVVTRRRAQMVLWSAPGMSVAQNARLGFASRDRAPGRAAQLQRRRVRLLYPRNAGGRPPTFTLAQRRKTKKIAMSAPADHDVPFSAWILSRLAEFLVAGAATTAPMRACAPCSAR